MTTREGLQRAAERTAGVFLEHIESVPIVETFRGQTVWEGIVDVFAAKGETAPLIYAWAVEGDKEPQYVTVLQKPPVKTPLDAVRAWIVSQSKKQTP